MTKKLELYKCRICGNLTQVMVEGIGELVCCGQPMEHLLAKNNDSDPAMLEKHVPQINYENEETTIYIDKHPMIPEHYIMFIQSITNDENEVCTKYLYPNEKIMMKLKTEEKNINARIYCNLHGVYENNKEQEQQLLR